MGVRHELAAGDQVGAAARGSSTCVRCPHRDGPRTAGGIPKETVGELRRERQDRRRPRAIDWALAVEAVACRTVPSWDDTRAVLSTIPEIVDAASDSAIEEADPYVLALARALKAAGRDACVVTEETRDAPWKVALATACGVLRIPAVTLREFLVTAGVGDAFSGPVSA